LSFKLSTKYTTMNKDHEHDEIAALEKEIRQKQEALTVLRRRLSAQRPMINTSFLDREGKIHTLSDLFGDKEVLIMIHNMGISCTYCSLWADGLNGFTPHLENYVSFVLCSPDPVAIQLSMARSRGWKFRMYSYADYDFIRSIGFSKKTDEKETPLPGVSVFSRKADQIFLESQAYFGPGDAYCSIWNMLDLLPTGWDNFRPLPNAAFAPTVSL